MSKLNAALDLAAQGFKVFPITPGAKAPPLVKDWPTKATTDPLELHNWWQQCPDANIGIHCDGYIAIDVDVKKNGNESLQLLEMTYGLPDTRIHNTPTGGRHLIYRHKEPVCNGVDVLGRGLDIRSQGGYLVAIGSTTSAGDYSLGVDAPVADAPEWLINKLGVKPVKAQNNGAPVADAEPAMVERARDWLKKQEPAVLGSGGDAHTFTIACGVRDLGLSANQAVDILCESWNDRCSPPWFASEIREKVENAYRYAQNEPGARTVKPSDFEGVPYSMFTEREHNPAVNTSRVRAAMMDVESLAGQQAKGLGYVVKGLLQRGSYAEVYGAPGEGKTFVALDMAYHIAGNMPWMGMRVHAGTVLYLAFEGTGGLVRRAQALVRKYGRGKVPLYIASAAMDLKTASGKDELAALLSSLPDKPVLIVIDTFARALMGGDENSAQDVGAFNNAVQALIEATGACVMIVHHSGKDKSRGARGSSALLAALDTEIEIDAGQVAARKQRDVEIADPIGFQLEPVSVGEDADGELVTSCIVVPATVQATSSRDRLTGNAELAFDTLARMQPDNAPVTDTAWKAACLANGIPNSSFYKAKNKLLKSRHINEDGNNVTRSIA